MPTDWCAPFGRVVTPLNKTVQTHKLYDCRNKVLRPLFECEYPWEMLSRIGDYINSLLESGIEGYTEIAPGVLVGENVKIHESAVILPPAVIGSGTEIRPGAFLRGNVIVGEGCVLGNSSEFKNCVLCDHVQAPHYNYVGDSVLGNYAHLGAGAVCSNLKAGGGDVTVHGEEDYPTGRRKVGAFLGDHADIGCGCVLNPGTVVGKNTSAYPLTPLRGVYPENCIIKSADTVIKRK